MSTYFWPHCAWSSSALNIKQKTVKWNITNILIGSTFKFKKYSSNIIHCEKTVKSERFLFFYFKCDFSLSIPCFSYWLCSMSFPHLFLYVNCVKEIFNDLTKISHKVLRVEKDEENKKLLQSFIISLHFPKTQRQRDRERTVQPPTKPRFSSFGLLLTAHNVAL